MCVCLGGGQNSKITPHIQILLRTILWYNSPWSNYQIVIPWTKLLNHGQNVLLHGLVMPFFIHGDNKMPFQTV